MEASHDGFSRLSTPATHRRSILFLKSEYWVIHDEVQSDGRHRVEFWLHWDAGVPAVQIEDNTIDCAAVLRISSFATNGGWRREAGWVSHGYGQKEEAPVCSFSMQSEGTSDLTTFLLPHSTAAVPSVRELPAAGGRAFEIDFQGHRDLLLLRQVHGATAAARVECARLASDSAWSWLRLGKGSRAEEYLLIGGESIEVDGTRLEVRHGASDGFCYVRN